MDKSVFKEVLRDIHLVEGGYDVSLFVDTTITEQELEVYDSLFASKSISQDDFLKEYDRYLLYHLSDLNEIYEELIVQFENIRDSIEYEAGEDETFEPIKPHHQKDDIKIKELKKLPSKKN